MTPLIEKGMAGRPRMARPGRPSSFRPGGRPLRADSFPSRTTQAEV